MKKPVTRPAKPPAPELRRFTLKERIEMMRFAREQRLQARAVLKEFEFESTEVPTENIKAMRPISELFEKKR